MDEICKNADLDIYPTEHMQFFDCYQSIVNLYEKLIPVNQKDINQELEKFKADSKIYYDIVDEIFNQKQIRL